RGIQTDVGTAVGTVVAAADGRADLNQRTVGANYRSAGRCQGGRASVAGCHEPTESRVADRIDSDSVGAAGHRSQVAAGAGQDRYRAARGYGLAAAGAAL